MTKVKTGVKTISIINRISVGGRKKIMLIITNKSVTEIRILSFLLDNICNKYTRNYIHSQDIAK